MSGFGLFEANVTSDAEQERQVKEAADKLAAATYDVRERFGQFLFGAKDLTEYNDRLALSKNDILKTIEPHVFPRTGTVRRVLKPLEREFKAMHRVADGGWGLDPDKVPLMGDDPGPYTPPANRTAPLPPGVSTDKPLPTMLVPGQSGSDLNEGLSPASDSAAPSAPSSIGGAGGGGNSTPPAPEAASTVSDTSAGAGSGWSPNGNPNPIGAGEYEIQAGDTLSSIADRAGISDYNTIADANDNITDPDMIYAGDTINIPGAGGDSTSTPTDTTSTVSDTTSTGDAGGVAGTGLDAVADAPALNSPENTNMGLTPTAGRRRQASNFDGDVDTHVTYSPSDDELEPEGDFKGYLKSVDQGAEGKAERNFGGTFPGGSDHDMDPAKTDFAKSATLRFARWCQANRVRASLSTLEQYSPSDREYIAIAATLQRVAGPTGPEWTAKGKPKKPNSKPDLGIADDNVELHTPAAREAYIRRCRQAGLRPTNAGFRKFLAGDHSLENRPRGNPYGVPGGRYTDPTIMDTDGQDPMAQAVADDDGVRRYPPLGKHRAPQHRSPWDDMPGGGGDYVNNTQVVRPGELVRSEDYPDNEPPMMKRRRARRRSATGVPGDAPAPSSEGLSGMDEFNLNEIGALGMPGGPSPSTAQQWINQGVTHPLGPHTGSRRRVAAPDYLQKADDALTNLLNQKAEEFQQSIAPLQQALQTVQQAEAEQQAANPMNVMPPAGTVNVMPPGPGGDPSGGGGVDPNALAGLINGGGGDPSMGGGAPPGMDPSAMGEAPPGAADQGALPPELMGGDPSQQQPQQMMARRRRANDDVYVPGDGHASMGEGLESSGDGVYVPGDGYASLDKATGSQQKAARRGKGRRAARPQTGKNANHHRMAIVEDDNAWENFQAEKARRDERYKSSFDNPAWENLTSHPDFEGSGWKDYDIDFLRKEYDTPEEVQAMFTRDRQFNDKVNAAATGASLADIGREHGVHPATLRDYSDLGNYTNYFDAPLKPHHEWVARETAQEHWPKKPKVDYSDPSSAQVGLTVARRGKAQGAARPRTAKNVDQLWEEFSAQETRRGGEPDVETFAQRYKVGPRALQRIRQKAMGG